MEVNPNLSQGKFTNIETDIMKDTLFFTILNIWLASLIKL